VWHLAVTQLQHEAAAGSELNDAKLSEIQRQADDTAALQQAAFDNKVSYEAISYMLWLLTVHRSAVCFVGGLHSTWKTVLFVVVQASSTVISCIDR